MNLCVLVVALSALVCAVATTFSLLVVMRIVAGLVAGGVFPIALALIGDLVPVSERQIAIGRLLAVGLTGNLVGASIAGVIGDVFGWRGVFAILGAFGFIVAIAAFFAFRGVATPAPAPFNRAAVLANFRSIFADPRAKVCFTSVFFEAVFIHGLFPYVAPLLLAIGETRASVAGLLIATFAVGGVLYSLSVPVLIAVCASSISWWPAARWPLPVSSLSRCMSHGFGRSPSMPCSDSASTSCTAVSRFTSPNCRRQRAAAASLHSSFFYLGQAVGPVIYGYGFAHGGPERSIFVGAAVVMAVGIACSRLLRHRTAD
jgi:MFS transporter, DHA1 family, inner membrane transport protein